MRMSGIDARDSLNIRLLGTLSSREMYENNAG